MPFAIAGAGVGAVGSIVGGGKQADATKKAAADQEEAANNATQLQRDEFNTVQANEQPYQQAGTSALSQIQSSLPSLTSAFNPSANGVAPTFSFDPSTVANDPAYQFALSQGTKAIQNSAASKGELLSGATQQALAQYGSGTASQFENQDYNQAQQTYQNNYSNAFNTFTANQTNAFSKLASLASIGQGGNAQVASSGNVFSTNAGNNTLAAGNAQSAGVIGGANAQANEFGNLSSTLTQLTKNPSFQNLFSSPAIPGYNAQPQYTGPTVPVDPNSASTYSNAFSG